MCVVVHKILIHVIFYFFLVRCEMCLESVPCRSIEMKEKEKYIQCCRKKCRAICFLSISLSARSQFQK